MRAIVFDGCAAVGGRAPLERERPQLAWTAARGGQSFARARPTKALRLIGFCLDAFSSDLDCLSAAVVHGPHRPYRSRSVGAFASGAIELVADVGVRLAKVHRAIRTDLRDGDAAQLIPIGKSACALQHRDRIHMLREARDPLGRRWGRLRREIRPDRLASLPGNN